LYVTLVEKITHMILNIPDNNALLHTKTQNTIFFESWE